MMSINNLKLYNILLCGVLLFALTFQIKNVFAQKSSPPYMPVFDESTVRQMLNSIDQEYNFPLLRVGYFGGHRKSPFPIADGFVVLKTTLETRQTGDIEWFLLESLRGSAAFHAPDIPLDDGFDAYGLIFNSVHLATTSKIQTALRTSVRDFVSSIDTSLKRKGYPGDPRVADLLLKAWNAWSSLPSSAADTNRPIDWGRAINAANAQDKFTAIVEAALKDTAHPPDFSMLKLAVVVLQDKQPQRAIALLKTAQSKLLPDDYYNQQWLYQTWVQLITGKTPLEQPGMKITDKTQLAGLADMRREQISYTGTGYSSLLTLYWHLGQNDKAQELLTVVKEPGIRAEEKIKVAADLLRPLLDISFSKETLQQLQQQGVDLLQTYLASIQKDSPQNELSTKNELHARFLLGLYFMKQDMVTEAGAALQTGDLKPPFHSSESAGYYDQLLQMKAVLEKKLADVK